MTIQKIEKEIRARVDVLMAKKERLLILEITAEEIYTRAETYSKELRKLCRALEELH